MGPARNRSPSHSRPAKKQKTAQSAFADGLFATKSVQRLKQQYLTSSPYKHALLPQLFEDGLLRKVRDECINELSFTEKETDIYKIHQTGDLASLSYLQPEQLALLPSLLTLRNALYSEEFRTFLRTVTGCGPLSGSKRDMAVNSYKKGCHLLNHDDVIGTRRISYILYMPISGEEKAWKPEWGGALELYDVTVVNGVKEPNPTPSKAIPPSWNQFVFFEVQPGHSFHSVEEVVVGTDEDGRQRLSISGWFHKAQEGEEGYEGETQDNAKSSLEQLSSSSSIEFQPFPSPVPFIPDTPLTKSQKTFLSKYLNPVYLVPDTLAQLSERFGDESSLELHEFLEKSLAARLKKELKKKDTKAGYRGGSREGCVPSHASGLGDGWKAIGPPHKFRYCILDSDDEQAATSQDDASTSVLRTLQDELFPSPAFRAWLGLVSSLFPERYAVKARRFRPGLDYTLATSEEEEARLDVVLGLTPSDNDEEEALWASGAWGGWECYMAPHEGEEDPAVYRSGTAKNPETKTDAVDNSTSNDGSEGDENDDEDAIMDAGEDQNEDASEEGSEADGSESGDEDGALLTVQPGFNRLLLVLRDQRVLRFVKYLSSAAQGSRWDICAEYQVGVVVTEEDDEGASN
ncbi:hypothetical protein SISNIDRAFT_405601 [Sistotremastrum niveocremeum HHB9708]|uniref:uS12 prolyl 3,4-dihydroxylase n=1 Tax=Sistotremastrum niveocremeum HHB9708 TaxID=1314777 RepID=A0A164ZLC7_9AGAM|nr:hypothetical protein SISNIDRAFT_405601 [Sistotremastrum niveocremeum HHB9708]